MADPMRDLTPKLAPALAATLLALVPMLSWAACPPLTTPFNLSLIHI